MKKWKRRIWDALIVILLLCILGMIGWHNYRTELIYKNTDIIEDIVYDLPSFENWELVEQAIAEIQVSTRTEAVMEAYRYMNRCDLLDEEVKEELREMFKF